MNGFETLVFEKVGAVARISLNRPEVLNAYNIQMRDDFTQAPRPLPMTRTPGRCWSQAKAGPFAPEPT